MRKRAPSAGGFTAIGAGLLDAERSRAAISPEAAVSNAGHKKPNAGAPFISGDFAAIEAGLLGSRQEKAAAIVSEATVSNTFPKVDLGSERWLNEDNTPVFRHGGIAGGHKRSRRAFYAMAAIAAAGMAGIAASGLSPSRGQLASWAPRPPGHGAESDATAQSRDT
jgi:hypothetical protein